MASSVGITDTPQKMGEYDSRRVTGATSLVSGATPRWKTCGLSSFLAVGSEGIADICAQLAASNGGSRERWKEGGY